MMIKVANDKISCNRHLSQITKMNIDLSFKLRKIKFDLSTEYEREFQRKEVTEKKETP